MKFLLYGANGYTGKLIAERAEAYGLTPILAGRSEDKIRPIAEHLGYEYRIFDLAETQKLEQALNEVAVVLHAAGPFKFTAAPMIKACLRTGTHYLDITGEIPVFELAASLDKKAKDANIMLMPGVGFDVVPTDCLGLFLKKQLPDATHLKLAFITLGGRTSHGTAMTMAENLGESSARRENGKIIKEPLGQDTVQVPYQGKKWLAVSIPWGDVSTSYYTTGIPNIRTYTGMRPSNYKWIKWKHYFNWLFRIPIVKTFIKRRITNGPAGPTAEERANSKTIVWGEVKNNITGNKVQGRLIVPNGYTLTVETSLVITKNVLEGKFYPGFKTPAGAFGENFIMDHVAHVERELISAEEIINN